MRPERKTGQVRFLARLTLVAVSAVICACPTVHAQETDARSLIADAERMLEQGRYDKAIEVYDQVEPLLPDSAELSFNRGVAHYRNKQYAEAAESFDRSVLLGDKKLQAHAKYNLGNVAYARALAEDTEPEAKPDYLRSAISSYRDALKADPKDTDARVNIENAARMLKQLIEQQEEQQQQNGDQNNEDQQEQPESQPSDGQQENQPESQPAENEQQQDQQSQNQESQNQDSQQQDGEQQNAEQQESEQEQAQQQEVQQQEGEQQQADQQETKPGERAGMMTREEAERLLQMIRDRERERREREARRQRVEQVPVEKDW